MPELLMFEISFLIGTLIFFSGLWLHDYVKRRKHQKWLDSLPPHRFINSSAFAAMIQSCSNPEQVRTLFELYKDR